MALVGFSARGIPQTDGTASETFLGLPWVGEFDVSTHVVVPTVQIEDYLFARPDVAAIFVGEPSQQAYGPSFIAIPKDALPTGFEIGTVKRMKHHADQKSFFAALRKHGFAAEFRREGASTMRQIRFNIQGEISRAAWFDLGFHIITKAARSDGELVVPIREGRAQMPFGSIEDARAYGIEVRDVVEASAGTFPCLGCRSFTVVDPDKSAPLMPWTQHCAPGTQIEAGPWEPEKSISLPVQALDEVAPLSGKLSFIQRAQYDYLAIPARDIKPRTVVVGYRTESPVFVANPAVVDEMLVSARKVGATKAIPEEVDCFPLYVDGQIQEGKYYLRSQVDNLPTRKDMRSEMAARREVLEKIYGPLPDDWSTYSHIDLEACRDWDERKNAGWITIEDFLSRIGLPRESWVQFIAVQWPRVSCRRETSPLVEPMTIDQMAEHEKFGELFSALFTKSETFLARCMFSDAVRAALMAKAIGG